MYQVINVSGSGDNVVLDVGSGMGMVVQELYLAASGTVDITLRCPDLEFTGPMHHAGAMGTTIWEVPCEQFIVNLSDAVQVGGWVRYETYMLSEMMIAKNA